MLTSTSDAHLVGRRRELAVLEAALAAGRDGHGRLVLVAGPAGIGKTALVRAAARATPARVVWSAAWDAGGAPPFWLWVQVLRGLAQGDDGQALRAAARTDLPTLTALVPELATPSPPGELLVEDRAHAGPPSAPAERFALFDAVAQTLRHVAAGAPLVLVLEDLHAADADALGLLDFLARGLSGAALTVVATLRDGEPVSPERAAALVRLRDAAEVVALDGLPAADVALLLDDAPVAERDRLARQLHAATAGNPLFVLECLRLLGDLSSTDATARAQRPVALPAAVGEVVARRLGGLDHAVRTVLDTAAVLGGEFTALTVAEVLAVAPASVLAALDEAAGSDLVRPLPGQAGRFAFTHAVVRETLHDALAPARRAALHREVAEALEDTGSLATLAHHYFEALPVAAADRAIGYARRAGDEAMRLLAFDRAEEHYAAALRALASHRRDERERCALLHALGEAQTRAGHLVDARRSLEEAFALAAARRDPVRAAEVALAAAPWGYSVTIADTGLVEMLERALTLGDPGPALRARLEAAAALAGYWTRPASARLTAVQRAVARARNAEDPRVLARVLADAHLATWDADSPERSVPWTREIDEIEAVAGDTDLALYAATWRISMLLETGRLAEADDAIAEFARRARASGQPRALRGALRHAGLRAVLDGRNADVERVLSEAATAGDLPEDSVDTSLLAGQAFVLRWSQGRLRELEPGVRQYAEDFPMVVAWRCALAVVLAQTGQTGELRRLYGRLRADGFAGVPRDNLWLVALTLLTDVCEAIEDVEGARALHTLLTPYAGRVAVLTDAAVFGPVDRSLARLARLAGDAAGALTHLAAARAQAGEMGARVVEAFLDRDEARIRRDLGEPDVGVLLDRAAGEAEALGLEQLGADVTALRTGAPAVPAAGVMARLERDGELWLVAFGARTFRVRDSKGMGHLATLLALPNVEVHALRLARGPAGRAAGSSDGLALDAEVGLGAVLDPTAKAAYRARLDELDADLELAAAFHDPERVARVQEERDALVAELAAAVGLGGRDRPTGSAAEKARVNVTRALRATIARLAVLDPELGRHLEATVRTGTACVHRADLGTVTWTVAQPS